MVQTHPVQYHAPLYRFIQERFGIPVTAIYASDFSVVGYEDREFGASVDWDVDLLSGYESIFLSRVADGGAKSSESASTRGLHKALEAANPNAILLPGYSPSWQRSAAVHALRSGLPVLFRGETTDHAVPRGRLKSRIRTSVLSSFYRRCSRLLYVGAHSRSHFAAHSVPNERLVFSPYCVDTEPFNEDEAARSLLRNPTRDDLGVDDRSIVLLFSGKISERKGPDLLLQAVKELPNDLRARVTLVYLGDGQLVPKLRAGAHEEPLVDIRFVGFRNQRQLSAYYHASDVLVLPSRSGETWGLVVNEALHHGLKVVVSDAVGCAPDLVTSGGTGEVFSSGSPIECARAIQRALSLHDTRTSREARRRHVASFGLEVAAKGVATAYRAVVGEEER